MGKIIKGLIFGGNARATVIDIKDIVNEEILLHGLSPLAAACLGRGLTSGAYLSSNLDENQTFSITVNGGGILGSMVIAGSGGGFLRGCVGNANIELPLKSDGHLDVGTAVGINGSITVVKDLGLKDPYIGKCALKSGEIAEDFASYLYRSEGVKNAVALGVKVSSDGCIAAGGVIVEALPDITEEQLFMLEDIMSNFVNVSDCLQNLSINEVFNFYFSHLDSEILDEGGIVLRCNCGNERAESIVKGFGKDEVLSIIDEVGKLEIHCHFCEKKYVFNREDVERLW